ncbi:hypothetical protein, partial [Vibrio sp. 1180_3]|uniref:hypothetical protein n=1 Tax=Vibrio sp. 1180_3 TaxID=2528832 RepID=UPI002405E333
SDGPDWDQYVLGDQFFVEFVDDDIAYVLVEVRAIVVEEGLVFFSSGSRHTGWPFGSWARRFV